jgi:probable HAF family extracellular repeat protein
VAVGYSEFSDITRGFRWTVAGGRRDFVEIGAPPTTFPTAVSGDGAVVVGSARLTNGTVRGFRSRGEGQYEELGPIPAYEHSSATSVSADGRFIGGYLSRGQNSTLERQAAMWTEGGEIRPLGYLRPGSVDSQVLGLSANGQVAVGYSTLDAGRPEGFVWTEQSGMSPMPSIINSPESWARELVAASPRGDVVVGNAVGGDGVIHAARWTAGEPLDRCFRLSSG